MISHLLCIKGSGAVAAKNMVFERLGAGLDEEFQPAFPFGEYEDRWRRTQQEMARGGVDMLWVSAPEDICYLTGHACSWYHDVGPASWHPVSGVAVHREHDLPIVFDDEDEQLLVAHLACAPDLRIAPNDFAEGLVERGRTPHDHAGFASAMDYVVQTLKDVGWLRGAIALQPGSYRPNRRYSQEFEATLRRHGATIVDGTDIVAAVRRRKSPLELETIRHAAHIGDAGMRALAAEVREGVTELELWAAATSAMAHAGGELSAIPGMVNSGPKNACLHGYASRRKLQRGDLINVDMCGVVNRYHSNLARCISLGNPSAQTRTAIDTVTHVYYEVRSAMYPGMPIAELLDINEKAARTVGIWENAWWVGGYELGVAFPPDWVGRFAFSAGEDPGGVTLEPGLVMNHEWNFYLPDGAGIRELIDTFIVTEDAIEFPHEVPADLIIAGS